MFIPFLMLAFTQALDRSDVLTEVALKAFVHGFPFPVLSDDGSAVIGSVPVNGKGYVPALWHNGKLLKLGLLPGFENGTATACTPDASIAVGFCGEHGRRQALFMWSLKTGMRALGIEAAKGFLVPWSISADGSCVLVQQDDGSSIYQNGRALRLNWKSQSRGVPSSVVARNLSADGTVATGTAEFPDQKGVALVWNRGVPTPLIPPGSPSSDGLGVSANGQKVLLTSGQGTYIWSRTSGYRALRVPTNFLLDPWAGLSADGTTAYGNAETNVPGFMSTMMEAGFVCGPRSGFQVAQQLLEKIFPAPARYLQSIVVLGLSADRRTILVQVEGIPNEQPPIWLRLGQPIGG